MTDADHSRINKKVKGRGWACGTSKCTRDLINLYDDHNLYKLPQEESVSDRILKLIVTYSSNEHWFEWNDIRTNLYVHHEKSTIDSSASAAWKQASVH